MTTGTAPPCTKKRNPITSKRLAGATGCTPSEHQSGRPEAVDSQILVEALFNAPPELHPSTFPAAVASRDLFERALQCPEDSGLTDLIVGRQGRHGLACRIALGDLALTEARPIPSVLAILDGPRLCALSWRTSHDVPLAHVLGTVVASPN